MLPTSNPEGPAVRLSRHDIIHQLRLLRLVCGCSVAPPTGHMFIRLAADAACFFGEELSGQMSPAAEGAAAPQCRVLALAAAFAQAVEGAAPAPSEGSWQRLRKAGEQLGCAVQSYLESETRLPRASLALA